MADRVIAGRLAWVTGGARGIGLSTARALVAEGLRVVLTDIDADAVDGAAVDLGGADRGVLAVALDVTDAVAFGEAVERVQRTEGGIDILINNAGIMPVGPFLEQDPYMDDRQIAINLGGVIAGMRAVLPGMLARRRGHVVNIASVAGKMGIPGIATYCATKHAVVGLTEAVRQEHLDSGVSFSYIMPSLVDTELTAGTGRLRYPPPSSPSDVANAVLYCLRTGQVESFVPRLARLAAILPALVPRPVYERVGRLFGVHEMFADVDGASRSRYRERIRV